MMRTAVAIALLAALVTMAGCAALIVGAGAGAVSTPGSKEN